MVISLDFHTLIALGVWARVLSLAYGATGPTD